MASRMRRKDRSVPSHYDSVLPLALPYTNQCSNKHEHIYSESGFKRHVDSRIFIIESRIESSSEKDLNELVMWKKDKCYYVLKLPFDENMAENGKIGDL